MPNWAIQPQCLEMFMCSTLTALLLKVSIKKRLNAFLQFYLEGLLPGARAAAEAMGRPQDTVIALNTLNVSHVTALLLYSLFLHVRWHKARGGKILSKHSRGRKYELLSAAIS